MKKHVSIFTLLLLFATVGINAQTKEDAGNAYNTALELSNTDLPAALVKMQEVVSMCTTIGDEASDLKNSAIQVIPGWQFNIANSFLREKNYATAIIEFEKAITIANLYKDKDIIEKANNQLPKLYYAQAAAALKEDKNDEAIALFDKSLSYDPDFAKAYLFKGQAYKKKGDTEKMDASYKSALEAAQRSGDSSTIKNANMLLASGLLAQGNAAFKKKDYNGAIAKIEESLIYDSKNKDAYYIQALSYNSINKFDNAIEAAQTGLAFEEQVNEKMARFYFEIAKAYESKKDNANACANYKKAVFGQFAEMSKHKITVELKCK